ncbi:hypothetical protein AX16_010643 [Volvariella volvacea WC 439]|nr:hypothetical protein AX16_010643 [Volvariella volvacea WC 439]
MAPNRASSTSSQTTAAANLLEKKKEYDAVAALERTSSLYLERIQALADDCEVMADAGQVFGQVLEQWPKMFQTLSLFLESKSKTGEGNDEMTGQKLVRLPIEDLQEATGTPTGDK